MVDQGIRIVDRLDLSEPAGEDLRPVLRGKFTDDPFRREQMFFLGVMTIHDVFDALEQFSHILAVMGDGGENAPGFQNTGNMRNHVREKIEGVAAEHQIIRPVGKGGDDRNISRDKTPPNPSLGAGLKIKGFMAGDQVYPGYRGPGRDFPLEGLRKKAEATSQVKNV